MRMQSVKQPPSNRPQNRSGTGARDSQGRFRAGSSGNPGGRPRGESNVRDLARSHTEEALAVVLGVMKRSKNERSRLAAAETVLAYGWGKPAPAMPPGVVEAELDMAIERLDAAFSQEPALYERVLAAIAGEPDTLDEAEGASVTPSPGTFSPMANVAQ